MDEIQKLQSLVTEYNAIIKIKTVNMVWIGRIIFKKGPIFELYGSGFKDVIRQIINIIDEIFYRHICMKKYNDIMLHHFLNHKQKYYGRINN